MSRFSAIGLGEILWDVLPEGKKLGGAPANFAYHINALGGVGIPVSRVGDDELGRETLAELNSHEVTTDYIAVDPERPTGTVDAVIQEDGSAKYVFPDDVAWDRLTFDAQTFGLARQSHAICFGTLAQRSPTSREAIRALLTGAPDVLKVYDINLRQDFYDAQRIQCSLELADVLKINDEELAVVAQLFSLSGDENVVLQRLMALYDLQLAVLTRGSNGSLVFAPGKVSELTGQPVDVVDTIGAGDSFTAALTLAYLHGWELEAMHERAAEVAAFVCGQAGAMPSLPEGLRIAAEDS